MTPVSSLFGTCLPADDPSRRFLGFIKEAGEQSAALTNQLLAFSKNQLLSPKAINLNDIVRPDMKVPFMSGYTEDAVLRHGILHEQVNFLQKPYSPLALAQKIRDVLGEDNGPSGN